MLNAKIFGLMLVTVFAAVGCGVKAQTYVMDKERVGIENKGLNAGYIFGQPQFVETPKKTRRVYVLELSKPATEKETRRMRVETTTENQDMRTEEVPVVASAVSTSTTHDDASHTRKITLPNFDEGSSAAKAAAIIATDEPAAAVAAPTGAVLKEAVSYTVTKDDTLQKIAKKFYNSYGKWTKIYEANKEKMKNPNFVKPGTVLTIPAE